MEYLGGGSALDLVSGTVHQNNVTDQFEDYLTLNKAM